MTETTGAAAFAAFRDAVFDDYSLMMWLRAPLERDAYVARVVAVGAERGVHVESSEVWAALRAGEQAWLMQGADVV